MAVPWVARPCDFGLACTSSRSPRALPRSTCKNESTSDPHTRANIRMTVRMVRGIFSLFHIKALICIHFSHSRNPTALSFLADFSLKSHHFSHGFSNLLARFVFFLVNFLFLSLSRVRFSDFFKAF
ncbi:hypothetical protein HanIR_Chr05g0245101 [Helianthus annuus]|nr:hypothetical protein HanIR_Chr05g0245101 [Helianthus annuus]